MEQKITLSLQVIVPLLNSQNNPFREVKEFLFLIPFAEAVKQRGCYCGLGAQTQEKTNELNTVVQRLSPESVEQIKKNLKVDVLCFAIQSPNNFNTKCY